MLPGYLTQPEADYRIQRLLQEADAQRMSRIAPTGGKPRRRVLTARPFGWAVRGSAIGGTR